MTLALRPYQEEGRDFLASRRVALLADEMRVGKTPQAILAAHKAGAKSILVVTRAIAVRQWEEELYRWWPDVNGPRYKVLSFERATSWWQSGATGTIDVFIPDECHFAKNPAALRTQMVYGKTGFASRAGAVWPLSGTPAPKHAGELWPMLTAFGAIKMTPFEFEEHFCTRDWTGRAIGTKIDRIPELREIIYRYTLRRTRKQVAPDMPDIDFQFLNVDAPGVDIGPETRAAFDAGRETFDSEDRVAVAMAKAGPLAQEVAFAIGKGLLRQTVVFGWHREPLEQVNRQLYDMQIRSRLLYGGQSDRERQQTMDDFRDGRLSVICANILAAGTAIDLSAADHGFFLELDWVSGNNAQAANRLISMQKSTGVSFDVATMPGTVDDRIQKVLLRRVAELARLI